MSFKAALEEFETAMHFLDENGPGHDPVMLHLARGLHELTRSLRNMESGINRKLSGIESNVSRIR